MCSDFCDFDVAFPQNGQEFEEISKLQQILQEKTQLLKESTFLFKEIEGVLSQIRSKTVTYSLHKYIIYSKSEYFKNCLGNGMIESGTGVCDIRSK